MQEKKLPEGNHEHINQSPLEERTTYHIEGRSFVVQPVFKKENATTLGAILLRLMQADCENNR